MSAPYQIWMTDTPDGWFVTSRLKGKQRNSPRYLRADLTCGDCGYQHARGKLSGDGHKCEHANWLDAFALWFEPPDNSPACMAFTPKVTP